MFTDQTARYRYPQGQVELIHRRCEPSVGGETDGGRASSEPSPCRVGTEKKNLQRNAQSKGEGNFQFWARISQERMITEFQRTMPERKQKGRRGGAVLKKNSFWLNMGDRRELSHRAPGTEKGDVLAINRRIEGLGLFYRLVNPFLN